MCGLPWYPIRRVPSGHCAVEIGWENSLLEARSVTVLMVNLMPMPFTKRLRLELRTNPVAERETDNGL